MIAAPALHNILFFLYMLFGIDTPIIGQQADVSINLADKTGRITYQYLVTSRDKAHDAGKALKKLHNATAFNKRYAFMKLDQTKFHIEKEHLNIEVLFSFQDKQVLLERLGFRQDKKKSIHFKALERETIITSNGNQEGNEISWPVNASVIQLKIAGEVLSKKEKESSVNLAKYWEE